MVIVVEEKILLRKGGENSFAFMVCQCRYVDAGMLMQVECYGWLLLLGDGYGPPGKSGTFRRAPFAPGKFRSLERNLKYSRNQLKASHFSSSGLVMVVELH